MKITTNKILFSVLFFITSFTATCFAKDDFTIVPIEQAVSIFDNLPLQGVLSEKHNGYIYVDVPNDFISKLFPIIEKHAKEECGENIVIAPPTFYTKKNGIGAHISTMYETERVDQEIWNIDEIGQTFSFKIKEIRFVKILGYKAKKLYLVALECPELEHLRKNMV